VVGETWAAVDDNKNKNKIGVRSNISQLQSKIDITIYDNPPTEQRAIHELQSLTQ
jgi:hypothetical protein